MHSFTSKLKNHRYWEQISSYQGWKSSLVVREQFCILTIIVITWIYTQDKITYNYTHIHTSVFQGSVVSDSLWSHELQHARFSCLSPSPRVCRVHVHWISEAIHPSISSSAALFSFFQSFSASGSFPMSRLFLSGGQSTGASTSASVLPMSIQGWFPLILTGLISLQSKELSRTLFSTTVWKHQFFRTEPSLWSNFHICTWLLEKS